MPTILRLLLIAYYSCRSTKAIRAERACMLIRKQVLMRRQGNAQVVELANVLLDATNVVLGRRGDRERRRSP